MPTSRRKPTGLTEDDLKAALDRLDEGVIILDGRGLIIGINRVARAVLEVSDHDALGADFRQLWNGRLDDPASTVQQSITQRRPVRNVDVQATSRLGLERLLSVRTDFPNDDEAPGNRCLIVFRDVTESAAMKRKLARRKQSEEAAASEDKQAQASSAPAQDAQGGAAVVRQALAATDWNVSKAARRLDISRTTLYKRMSKLGLTRPDE